MLSKVSTMKVQTTMEIYGAGSLFNLRETHFNSMLTKLLEDNEGFKVNLPQRDGFEFSNLSNSLKPYQIKDINSAIQEIIFYYDLGYLIPKSQVIIANLDEPLDPGVDIEIAHAFLLGKMVIGYRNDSRGPFKVNSTDLDPFRGMHFFPALQCTHFINQSVSPPKTHYEGLYEMKRLVDKIVEIIKQDVKKYSPEIVKSKCSDKVRQILEGAELLFDSHWKNGNAHLEEICKRFNENKEKLGQIRPIQFNIIPAKDNVVDLNCFFEISEESVKKRKETAMSFLKNLENDGCSKITCSNLISKEELCNYVKLTREVFKISKDIKEKYSIDREAKDYAKKYGFRSKLGHEDNFEYFITGNFHKLNGWTKQEFTGMMSEDKLEEIKKFHSKMNKLSLVILEALGLSLKNQDSFLKNENEDVWNDLVMINYPWVNHTRVVKAGHYDYSALAILHTTNSGLQFEVDYENGVWKDVTTDEGEFVVNCGEMLEALTNKKLKSAFHRVISAPYEEFDSRISVLSFVNLGKGMKINGESCWEFYDKILKSNQNEIRKKKIDDFNSQVTLNTSHGKIKLEIFCELVPMTAKNFLALCASGAYDDTKFHRNIPGFIIQGGDPEGSGKGGASIYGKNFKDEFVPQLKHEKRGIVSMANSGPNTNNAQFFITYSKQSHLNNVYTVFGKVIDGFECLDLMEKEPVDSNDKPLNDIILYNIWIHANPIAENEQI